MLFEMISQEFKVQGTKYQVLPNFGICCRELGGLKVMSFLASVRSFCSVYSVMRIGLKPLRRRIGSKSLNLRKKAGVKSNDLFL